jgi:hypothetical protein
MSTHHNSIREGLLHLATALVEGLAGVLVRLSAVVLVAARHATGVGSVAGADASIVQSAVGTVRNTVLVEVVGVEAVARGEVGLAGLDGSSLVENVLVRGVIAANLGVERTGEELGTHPVVGGVDSLATAGSGARPGRLLGTGRGSCGSGSRRSTGGLDDRGRSGSSAGKDNRGRSRVVNSVNDRRRDGGVGGIISVGSSHDNVEVLAPFTLVGSSGSLKVRSPKSALEVGDGRGVGAPVTPDSGSSGVVLGRVLAGVALNVDVEGSAERSGITVSSTVRDVVRAQSVKTKVRVGAGRGVQVAESLEVGVTDIAVAGDDNGSVGSHAVEGSVGKEGRIGVGSNLGTISVRLRSAWVLRVNEPTVSALLGGGRASGGGRCGSRDGVDGGRAGRGRRGSGRRGSSRRRA